MKYISNNMIIVTCTLSLMGVLFTISAHTQVMVQTITEEFEGSGGLNMGSDGKLYVANFGKSLDNGTGTEVWKIDYKNDGSLELFATGLNGASGNDFDSEGYLFQSSIAAGKVSKISPDGIVSFFTSSGISCNVGINIDAEDNVYVCNCCGTTGNTIRKVTKGGVSTTFSSSSLFSCPNGITRDSEDNLYVSNFSNGNIVKIDPNGQATLLAITPGIPGASGPSNGHIIYSEKEDVLYVASHGSHRIYRLSLVGELAVLAGTGVRGNSDGIASAATFSRPNGLALSISEDTLFVNSSVPLTDANGRPLNPSVIRMITGLRSTSTSQELPAFNYSLFYDSSSRRIRLSDLSIYHQDLEVILYTQEGKRVHKERVLVNSGKAEIAVPLDVSNGLYIISIQSSIGVAKSEVVYVY